MNSEGMGVFGRYSGASVLSEDSGSFESETAGCQRKFSAFGHTVTLASASLHMDDLPDSHTGNLPKSVDRNEGVPLYRQEENKSNPESHTIAIKGGRLTPEQKQELLDHVDKQDLPLEQKKQVAKNIETADSWLKSVSGFFNKHGKGICAFAVLIIVGSVLSVVLPVVLPLFLVIFCLILTANVFAEFHFKSRGNVDNNNPENNNSIRNNDDNNQPSPTGEDDNASLAAREDTLLLTEAQTRKGSGCSTPQDEQTVDTSTEPGA